MARLCRTSPGSTIPARNSKVLLLLEPDDPETLEAAKAAAPPDVVKFIVVPNGGPKTKPKACNVGLMFSRGEYLVIYDAEDRPEPDQLKKVVVAFEKSGPDLACVQAALNYYNAEENILTRMFTLEYSYWFDYMLPGLDALRLPIPLGGTSNHFRTAMLRQLGGWDPYNVTEDADLGIRASALGNRVQVINSTTYEEANKALGNWIRQRSRWIKGYMQTVLVHSRHPTAPGEDDRRPRDTGVRAPYRRHALVVPHELSSLGHLHRVDAGLVAVRGVVPALVGGRQHADALRGNAAIVYLNMLAVFKRRRYRLIWFGLLNPLYWLLHSIASFLALWQLMAGQAFFWENTRHGLTRVTADPTAIAPAKSSAVTALAPDAPTGAPPQKTGPPHAQPSRLAPRPAPATIAPHAPLHMLSSHVGLAVPRAAAALRRPGRREGLRRGQDGSRRGQDGSREGQRYLAERDGRQPGLVRPAHLRREDLDLSEARERADRALR